ncbi:Crp/Fnr family transcriptional regulator [Oryzobacter terrae]|uniref:Crp/Fnr family transcriptional regulator n=1 Tax=Oryzobacter terrae TaxID=1620385 RepID=UPI003670BD62
MDPGLLAALPEASRRAVLAASVRRRYARGEVVFHEGDLAETVHLVAEGRAAVRRGTPAGDTVILAVVGPGELVGEMAMLSSEARRTTTVVALEPTVTMTIAFGELDRLRRDDAAVDRFLLELLAHRVRRLSDHLLEALHVPVEHRVVRRLDALCRAYDGGTHGPTLLPLTQSEIGELAGASRPVTNRVLRRLEDDGVVELRRGAVAVLDRAALARRARG